MYIEALDYIPYDKKDTLYFPIRFYKLLTNKQRKMYYKLYSNTNVIFVKMRRGKTKYYLLNEKGRLSKQ